MNTTAASRGRDRLPELAAIVVTADSGVVTEDCVAAVLGEERVSALRVFDNASHDGVPQQIVARHDSDPRLQVHFEARNIGFGRAVNQAAEGLATPWMLVLNPDVILRPGQLVTLLELATGETRLGLLGVMLVGAAGQVDPASRRRDPLLRRALAKLRLWPGEGVADDRPAGQASVQAVENVSGALMLIRREAFAQLGGFDPGFFLHFEDLDLCRRLRDAGWEVGLAGEVRVTHLRGTSSTHRPVFVAWHKHRGMWRWFLRHDPLARHLLLRPLVWAGIWGHFLLCLPLLCLRGLTRRRRSPAAAGNLP